MKLKSTLTTVFVVSSMTMLFAIDKVPAFLNKSDQRLEKELIAKYGEKCSSRIKQGIKQVAMFWQKEDGDAKEFELFVKENFYADENKIALLLGRFGKKFEAIDGYFAEMGYELRKEMDLDCGELLPVDALFGGYDPAAHLNDDFFKNKIAFIVLLNFPIKSLDEKNREGSLWSRRQWAEVRLAQRFSKRIPGEVVSRIGRVLNAGELYTSDYKIWMHNCLDENGNRLFPEGLVLISHWNLRDEIKAQYSEPDGLERQRMIQKIMERIITQTIPRIVINNPKTDWKPYSNVVISKETQDRTDSNLDNLSKPEPNTRYKVLLDIFKAIKASDKYCPFSPTYLDRKFNEERQISKDDVERMLDELLSSPLLGKTANLIEKRLGRPLEPFDIWYNGFRPNLITNESMINSMISKKYPDADSFHKDMTNILERIGFSKERAEFLQKNIQVEASRGTGHAMGHAKRGYPARLRTHIGTNGMDYKGFNIAMHEMGHNVEQTFSLNMVDYTLLYSVPNNACTEAIAYVFQDRDLKALAISRQNPQSQDYNALDTYWMSCEIAAVALVEIKIWEWLYKNPNATPEMLKEMTIKISKDVWNRYYANVFKKRDEIILGVYSHMFFTPLYLADYPIGHLVSFQIEEKIRNSENLGAEIERIASYGNLTPDLWMINATGSPLSTKPLLKATERAIENISK